MRNMRSATIIQRMIRVNDMKEFDLICEELKKDNTVRQPVYIVPESLRGIPIRDNLEEIRDKLQEENK